MTPALYALLLAEHVYRDADSGSYVLAGTFHHVRVAAFPSTLGTATSVFVGLSGLEGDIDLELDFRGPGGDLLVASRELGLHSDDPRAPVEFAVRIPPLPLPGPGHYALRLAVDGELLGELPVIVEGPPVTSQDLAAGGALR